MSTFASWNCISVVFHSFKEKSGKFNQLKGSATTCKHNTTYHELIMPNVFANRCPFIHSAFSIIHWAFFFFFNLASDNLPNVSPTVSFIARWICRAFSLKTELRWTVESSDSPSICHSLWPLHIHIVIWFIADIQILVWAAFNAGCKKSSSLKESYSSLCLAECSYVCAGKAYRAKSVCQCFYWRLRDLCNVATVCVKCEQICTHTNSLAEVSASADLTGNSVFITRPIW